MANNKFTYQQVQNVSINKNKLSHIAMDERLSKTDLRLIFILFTKLNGYNAYEAARSKNPDPENYTQISIRFIAEMMNTKKEKVKDSINKLIELDYIEMGSSLSVKNGYRFTF